MNSKFISVVLTIFVSVPGLAMYQKPLETYAIISIKNDTEEPVFFKGKRAKNDEKLVDFSKRINSGEITNVSEVSATKKAYIQGEGYFLYIFLLQKDAEHDYFVLSQTLVNNLKKQKKNDPSKKY